MKKFFAILLSALLVMLFLIGCGQKEEPKSEPVIEEPAETITEDSSAVMDTSVVEEDTTAETTGH